MAAAAILDLQFMWIWPNLVQISVIVTEIDAHMLQTFIWWLSRELTSGFNFWSRDHLCMALIRLPMKFGADIFIQSGVIDIFSKLKMAAAAILELLGWAIGPPTKPHWPLAYTTACTTVQAVTSCAARWPPQYAPAPWFWLLTFWPWSRCGSRMCPNAKNRCICHPKIHLYKYFQVSNRCFMLQ